MLGTRKSLVGAGGISVMSTTREHAREAEQFLGNQGTGFLKVLTQCNAYTICTVQEMGLCCWG